MIEFPPPPRAARLTEAGRQARFWGRAILGAVWAIGLVLGFFHVYAEWSLWRKGRVEFVRIEDKIEVGGQHPSHRVKYTLTVPGYVARIDENVENGWFWAANVGGSAPVTYVPDRPQVHEFGRVDESSVWWAVRQAFLLPLVASVIPFVIFAGTESQTKRQLDLIRRGVLSEAKIVKNTPSSKYGKNSVGYAFVLPDGTRRTQTFLVDGSGGERFALGANLTVVYPPDESFESMPLDEVKMAELA